MNIATLVVLLLLAALCILAVHRIKAKKLLSSCGGNCSACGSCSACRSCCKREP